MCGPVAVKLHPDKRLPTGGWYRCAIAVRTSDESQPVRSRPGSRSHGLTPIQAAEFTAGKVCTICRGDNRLTVDHDHETGKIRGVLCNTCNRALGMFRDSPELLVRAILYLAGELPPERADGPVPGEHFWGPIVRDLRGQHCSAPPSPL